MTTHSSSSVLILGAGLTGLVTAYHLSRQGHQVTILDYPGWQEGCDASASDAATIALGCHHETHHLLGMLQDGGAGRRDATLPLEFDLPEGRIVPYRTARLPGALQWMTSLFSFEGLTWQDRWKLFSHLERIWEDARSLPADLDNRMADEWLATIGQSESARQQIWQPLAQWLTGNALSRLSAAVFVRVLSNVFLRHADDARLTYVAGSVEDRFLAPLRTALHSRVTRITPLDDSPALRFAHNRLSGVVQQDHTLHTADWYVSTVPPRSLLALVPERLLTRYAYFAHMAELVLLPQITVRFSARTMTRVPRLILLRGRSFDRLLITALESQMVQLELSTSRLHRLADAEDRVLIDQGEGELRRFQSLLQTNDIEHLGIQRDAHAALSLLPGTAFLRPIQRSPISNLLVAGAWTDTGWPANLESALVSAKRCVEAITTSASDGGVQPPSV